MATNTQQKYKYAEKCLYDYPMNQSRLKILSEDLRTLQAGTDVHAQQYDKTTGQIYLPYDPVLSRVEKLDALERRIHKIERYTKPITLFLYDLETPNALDCSRNKEYLNIVKLYYFGGNSLNVVAEELHCSRSTLYSKRRSIVFNVMEYLGF